MKNLIGIVLVLMVVGCSSSVKLLDQAGKISGKLTSSDGQAVANVSLTFQPLETGLPATVQVSEQGAFELEMHAGKYAYFVGKSTAKSGEQALKKVDAKFYEPDMSRTVVVQPGQELSVVLK
jgi:pyridoxine 5'-phosphate synthase PdxJ